jgi:hypothetical protein
MCYWAILVLSLDCPLFGLTVFDSTTLLALPTIFFYNLTNADAFCSLYYTHSYNYTTIHLYHYRSYNMRLLGLEKEGWGILVWLE